MFTPGRLIFASIFLIVFILAMVIAYRKDSKQAPWMFRGPVPWIVMGTLILLNVLYHIFGKS